MEKNYDAAFADVRHKYPGPYETSKFRALYWEDATDKEKYDSGYYWIQDKDLDTRYCLAPLSEQEKQEQKKAVKEKIEGMYYYMLENYGIKFAERFRTKTWVNKFKNYNVKIDVNYPHCKYNEGQCDIFCNFFRGKCSFKDDETGDVAL